MWKQQFNHQTTQKHNLKFWAELGISLITNFFYFFYFDLKTTHKVADSTIAIPQLTEIENGEKTDTN